VEFEWKERRSNWREEGGRGQLRFLEHVRIASRWRGGRNRDAPLVLVVLAMVFLRCASEGSGGGVGSDESEGRTVGRRESVRRVVRAREHVWEVLGLTRRVWEVKGRRKREGRRRGRGQGVESGHGGTAMEQLYRRREHCANVSNAKRRLLVSFSSKEKPLFPPENSEEANNEAEEESRRRAAAGLYKRCRRFREVAGSLSAFPRPSSSTAGEEEKRKGRQRQLLQLLRCRPSSLRGVSSVGQGGGALEPKSRVEEDGWKGDDNACDLEEKLVCLVQTGEVILRMVKCVASPWLS
jgi:hypothetical protein